MLQNFDMNLFLVLHVLLEERSVTRTGERLGRTQSAISNSLKRLRDTFGDPLMIPTPKGLSPTPKALALAPAVAEIVRGAERCAARTESFEPATAEARVLIGAPDRFSLPVFLPLLEHLRNVAPGIAIALRTADRDNAVRMIDAEEIDMALGWFDRVPAHVNRRHAYAEPFVCLCHRTHPMIEASPRPDLDTILAFPHLVVSSTGDSRAAFDALLAPFGLSRSIATTLTSFTVVPELLLNSNLLGVFTKRTADYFARRFDLVTAPVPLEVAPLDNELIWHRRFDSDEAHAWLRDQIIRICAPATEDDEASALEPR